MQIIDRFRNIMIDVLAPTIVEIGANDAYHTNLLCKTLKDLNKPYQYFLFEPDPRLKPYIIKNIANTGAIFSSMAIGKAAGKFDFHLSSGPIDNLGKYSGSSSLHKPTGVLHFSAWPDMRFETTLVDVCTLEDVVVNNNISYIDFIWMDVQGAENDVIDGAVSVLNKIKYIYTEYSDGQLYGNEIGLKEIFKRLPTFEIIEDYGGDVLLKNVGIN